MNPAELSDRVKKQYIDYLRTTFYLKDPTLRASFAAQLEEWRLSQGPYLQATPTFRSSGSLSAVYKASKGKDLDPKIEEAFTAGRPLYSHQEKAVSKVLAGKNIVVSTGTGSGKTESFLLPILLDLHEQHQQALLGPGVRALILYPMNALANDQRDRLVGRPTKPGARGGIAYELEKLKADFAFTTGQYIGETPEDAKDTRRLKSGVEPGVGELAFREDIRRTPPNILLTNFSMLEYLLLRPNDSPLFDRPNAGTWTYLVLDEAHQYRGAMGIEMAMLIRRLKQRLREEGCENTLRCIATSASLVNGDHDIPAVAKFASDLFGEPFDPADVILGEPAIENFSRSILLQPGEITKLATSLKISDDGGDEENKPLMLDIAKRGGIPIQDGKFSEMLGTLLIADKTCADLKEKLAIEPQPFSQLSSQLFPTLQSSEAQQTLEALVELLLNAKNHSTGNTLLSARYHLFLRSLEGAFLVFNPNEGVALERRASGGPSAGYELALCRECGQHYLVGKIEEGFLKEAKRDPSAEDFGADFFLVREELSADADTSKNYFNLCVECGETTPIATSLNCKHKHSVFLEQQEAAAEKEDQIPKCMECGSSGRDPVREVIHGSDGPHAVIASTMYRNLPKERSKVLAFADGRQDAAFFAWYLEQSYNEILNRCLIVSTLKEHADDASEFTISEFMPLLVQSMKRHKMLPKTAGELDNQREALVNIYRELLTDKLRISPEGVGLTQWALNLPEDFPIPETLSKPPWNLNESQSRELISVLLDLLRLDHAVELDARKTIGLQWGALNILGQHPRISAGAPSKKADLKNWAGKTSRRMLLLKKYLESQGVLKTLDYSDDLLREIWDAIKEYDRSTDNAEDKILVPIGDGYRLNARYYRLKLVRPEQRVLVCETCKRLCYISIGLRCPRHGCPGKLLERKAADLESNHYRDSYQQEIAGVMRVEEHTAQLNSDKAREFQRDFKEGKINILSCSTTFELGVDLGDLDTVFLRNVPPEAFNYDQRVGRSGRRRGHAGFAITFCKRSPHDLYHFTDPMTMLKGRVKPPILAIKNPKIILRHLTAYALSVYFRQVENRDRFKSMATLFSNLEDPKFASDFHVFLTAKREYFSKVFKGLVPQDAVLIEKLGLNTSDWIELMSGLDSKLEKAQAEISNDYSSVIAFEKKAAADKDYKLASWAKLRAKTIAEDNVLSFLSRKTVIPKYGFPVDVVELDTKSIKGSSESYSVGLDRDLSIAISEFAPGSQLIANKKLWTSYGIKKLKDKELETKQYFRCPDHNIFQQWSTTSERPAVMGCACRGQTGSYIIPSFGFTTSKAPPAEPTGRVTKLFSNRPYFLHTPGNAGRETLIPEDGSVLKVTQTMPGIMVVLCEGKKRQGFQICSQCGTGSYLKTKPKKVAEAHKDPYDRPCNGTMQTFSLAHQFETDIVQLTFMHPPTTSDKLWFAYSLASALVEAAATVLEVPASDISATVGPITGSGLPAIIVYDNVPGGAGLVAKLEQEKILLEVLKVATARVEGKCGCSEETSCYGCLRSYRNQFAHEQLTRGAVYKYLTSVLEKLEDSRMDVGVT